MRSIPERFSDPIGAVPRTRTEVGVPSAAEVSADCVLGPWEHVGTCSLKESWEVTHGDKTTPGSETGDIRTPPGLGDCGSARSPFPACLHGLCPPRRHHPHSDLCGWHIVFPGKPRHREVLDRVSGPRPEARPLGPRAAAGRWVGLRQPVS